MAHECPKCGNTCFCNGDVADVCDSEQASCTHCGEVDEVNYEGIQDDWIYWPEVD